ncbi:MAG TPA: CpsB/CapC family capsule biosynthesis tyrosine phosphatase [Tepidisphaeraceae bacterium]|jgi:protein-tyrosine phosphatase|nr:CpsB/CapC family capsule biosynthesis tyrosine phosphatase [Tepidisphaeraceae bacterium]
MTTGRIDVHSHLLPGVDDGCKTIEESLACARLMVAAGYTQSFCTPHIWPSYAGLTTQSIPQMVSALQGELDANKIALRLIPGGEINLRPDYATATPPEEVVTYAMNRKYVLFDIWCDRLPEHVAPSIEWLQSLGLTVILAHPERMRAVQDEPELADYFTERGVLLQGNLQCFSDAPTARTRQIAERFLQENRYFMLGSDLHSQETLPPRLEGLKRAAELVGNDTIDRLTKANPAKLLPE